ncbi:hypothetical protein ACHAXM_008513 [Skeletonema potamos]|jgi:hypothetical protein
MTSTTKKVLFTLASIALGIYAQIHKMQITGPIFDPILAACSAPHESVEAFVKATGYQPYEPVTGMGIFTPLACVVTQFMYQLRNIYPEGYITWGLAVVGIFPLSLIMTIEGGRNGAKGPLRYPICMGIISQLLGMSVSVPLVWVPAYIWGRGEGPVSSTRLYLSVVTALPACIFSALVFLVDTDSYLWRLCAGILGGPALAVVSGGAVWFDVPPNKESKMAITKHVKASKETYGFMTVMSLVCWAAIVHLTYTLYGFDLKGIWSAIFTDADAGVAFLTIDYILIYIAVVFGFLAYQNWSTAINTLLALPFFGPAALTIAAERLEIAASEKMLEKAKVA